MQFNFSESFVEALIRTGVVPIEDKDLYTYGVKQGLFMVINFATIVIIGLLFGMVWQSIIFILAYIPVRPYAGGYHADSQLSCYLLSIPLTVAVLLGMKIIAWDTNILFTLLATAGIVIFLFAPVEDKNKKLDEKEIKVYRKKARVNTAILVVMSILLWIAGLNQITICIAMALGVVMVLLILGVLKNRRIGQEKA